MINNIDYTIKIDLEQSCELLMQYDADMFDVTLKKLNDNYYQIPEWKVKGNRLEIQHWFYLKSVENQKKEEDRIIEALKNDDLTTVCNWLERRK